MSRAEAEQIHESYSPLTQFLAERCATSPDSRVTSTDLYAAYKAWCVDTGEEVLRPKTFAGAVKDATRGHGVAYGVHRFDGDAVARGFRGLGVKS